MSLRFIDSFNHYGTNDLLGLGNGQKWSGFTGLVANLSISVATGRFGNSFRLSGIGSTATALFKTIDNQSTWVIGFAFKYSQVLSASNGSMCIAALYDSGTNQVELRLFSDLTLGILRNGTALTGGRSTVPLLINVWYYIEWYCTISSSISVNGCNVNLNGANIITVTTGQSTKNTANSTANGIYLGYATTATTLGNTWDYSDLYICDGTGSAPCNTFLGDCKTECRWPTSPSIVNTNWLPNGGNSVGCVNDLIPNGDNNYISSSGTNDVSTFKIPPLVSTPTTVYGIQITHSSRKSDAAIRQMSDMVRSSGVNYVGNIVALSASYQMFPNIYMIDPATSGSWTQLSANALEIGVKEIT